MSVSVNGGEKREKCRAKRVEWLVPDVDQDLKTKSLSYPQSSANGVCACVSVPVMLCKPWSRKCLYSVFIGINWR